MNTSHFCIFASVNETEWELQLYDMSERRLDVAPVYTSRPLIGGLPITVDFIKHPKSSQDSVIMLFSTGVQVFSFSSHEPSLKSLMFVPRPPTSDLKFLTHMILIPSKLESVLPRCVVLDSAGHCCVITLETSESFSLTSKTNFRVADAWSKIDPTLGTVIWMVVDTGLKLWIPSLDPVGEIFQSDIVDVAFAEVGSLPVGSDEDAFICFQAHSYDIRASKSPVLHGILGWLLRRNRDGLARRVLAERRFSKSVRLVRAALEDLLQGALLGENRVEVRKVVNLLGCVPFEVMAAVVARCARQIDPELWDILFSVVGDPKDLFEQCLVRFDSFNQPVSGAQGTKNELLLIAAELLPIVDADKSDPQDGPIVRAKQLLKRCEPGGTLEKEVHDYAEKRGLDIASTEEDDESNFDAKEVSTETEGNVISSVLNFFNGF